MEQELYIPVVLTPTQAAALLNCSLTTVYRRIKLGELKCMPGTGNKRIYGDQFFSRPKVDRIAEIREAVRRETERDRKGRYL